MKLVGSFLGVGFVTIAVACSSSSSNDSSSQPSTTQGAQPPASPSGAATADTTDVRTFAFTDIFFGETNRAASADGAAKDANAWKTYGYNLDGLVTDASSTNVCAAVVDGNNGIDNSFGKTILPLIEDYTSNPSATLSNRIKQSGSFTVLATIKGLSNDPNQSATGLSGDIRAGADLGQTPTFTTSESWPYDETPIVPFSGAYINNGTFVYGNGNITVPITVVIGGQSLSININHAVITFNHTSDDQLTNGTIAGVVNTEDLVAAIQKAAGNISDVLCSSLTLQPILQKIRSASDILSDDTNAPGVACAAISIGVGFIAKRVGAPGAAVPDATDTTDPCTTTAQ
jgi:hypothetical protein